MKQKIPEETVYTNFSVKAAGPLISAKDHTRTEGLNFVTAALKKGDRVTEKEMQTTLNGCISSTAPREQKPRLPLEKPNSTNAGSEKKQEPITLHPNIKKKDPDECFSPQPGTVDIPDAPIAQTLAEQMKPEPGIIPFSPPRPKPAPCQSNQSCPDGKNHIIAGKDGKNKKCLLWNQFLNQLPAPGECYLDAKARKDQAATKPGMLDQGNTAFSRGGELPKTYTSGRILTREEKMRVLKETILNPKQFPILTMRSTVDKNSDDELMALDNILEEERIRLEVV